MVARGDVHCRDIDHAVSFRSVGKKVEGDIRLCI
jgi:hypothetical protein